MMFITVLHISFALGQQVVITPDKADGVYDIGETVTWSIDRGDTSNIDVVRYKLKDGGLIAIDSGEFDLRNGSAKVQYTFGRPGTVLLDMRWGEEDTWRDKAVGGAVASPEKLVLSAPRPAGFDMLGPELGRKGGWAQWYSNVGDKNAQKVFEASRYFDVANFVTNIKCPILVGVGLLDEICPPEGILAAMNLVTTPKNIMILPRSQHQDLQTGSQVPFNEQRDNVWLPALKAGKKLPID